MVGPIYQTSLFTFKNFESMRRAFAGESSGYIYSRVGNPTAHDFERRIAALEGAEAARGFASGMAAISATVLSVVKSGERIVAVRHCYGDAYRFFEKLLPRFGISVDYVDGSDARPSRRRCREQKFAISKVQFDGIEMQDFARLARPPGFGHRQVVDNSWPPGLQKTISWRRSWVHSASKTSAHSDTVAVWSQGRRR